MAAIAQAGLGVRLCMQASARLCCYVWSVCTSQHLKATNSALHGGDSVAAMAQAGLQMKACCIA